jgi:LysR family hydrogen peroxide-inducible transcriptional activator
MQLRKLEDEYGITFFDRSKQPILPLPKAVPIIEQAKVILSGVRRLDHLCKHHDKATSGEFRLATIPTVAPYLLPLFLGSFAKKYPKVLLHIEEMTTDLIREALENEKIDAGILATPLGNPSFTERPLYYEPFYLLVSPGHPLAEKEKIREEDLDGSDIWLLREGHCFRNQIVRVCSLKKKTGVFPNVQFESGNLETLIQLVAEGHGYTLLPHLATKGMPPGERKKLLRPFVRPQPTREISLVYRRTQYKVAILNALASEIEERIPEELPRERTQGLDVVKI